jgi:predicted O-methyltransferase YrrM
VAGGGAGGADVAEAKGDSAPMGRTARVDGGLGALNRQPSGEGIRMMRARLRTLALRLPAIARLVGQRDALQAAIRTSEQDLAAAHEEIARLREELTRMSVLDAYVTEAPSGRNAFMIFDGEWSSAIPGIGMGAIGLFSDQRLQWISERIGTFEGKSILELGPLEGGHTFMMARDRPSRLLAIESNTRAFLKCLIAKNHFDMRADFLLGDFRKHVAATEERYDFVLASGVLYHMREPAQLLADISRITDCLAIWTHYYDDSIISSQEHLARRFARDPCVQHFRGIDVRVHEQRYLDALSWGGFCGGSAENSFWLTRASLLDVLGALDYAVEIGEENPEHPNGPSILLLARRR